MPTMSELAGPFSCPVCQDRDALGEMPIAFVWGGAPSFYEIGDEVRWWHDIKGHVCEPFVYRKRRFVCLGPNEVFNFGYHSVTNVVALQDLALGWTYFCQVCRVPFARVGVIIRSNKFVGGVLWTEEVARRYDALRAGADYFHLENETLTHLADLGEKDVLPGGKKQVLFLRVTK